MSISTTVISLKQQANFKRVSQLGIVLMIFASISMILSFLVSFPLAGYFTLMQQAIAHILTIVLAGVLKVGYVIYIIGRYERRLPF